MAEIVACPSCQRQLQIPENFFGQMVQCPECQHMFKAEPQSTAVQSSPPVSSAPPKSEGPPPWQKSSSTSRDDEDRPRKRRFEDDDDDRDRDRDRDRDDIGLPNRPRQHQQPHRAALILTLGILSICCVMPLITGTIAWILGNSDIEAMQRGTMDPSGMGQTQTGKTLGMIAVMLSIVGIAAYCLFFIVMMSAAPGHGRRF